ncbi:hypothetical protein [Streptomyces sp. NPDC006384]|uniref:hypothetical protein n=1 Tax=Streptomyces sp. NPDC006384 TaxID=3364745 RepID=UPI0036A655EB
MERQVTWSVSVYRHSGDAEVHEYTSHRLTSPASVREHVGLARERPWVSRIALTEHVREVTRRRIAESDLPGDGLPAATPAPAGGIVAARFYEIEGSWAGGLLSADDARDQLQELRRASGGAAGVAEAAGPAGPNLWEVTVVDFARPASEDLSHRLDA